MFIFPNVVVFDLGKVLVDFDYHGACDRLAAQASLSGAEIYQFLMHSGHFHRYESGLLTTSEFFREFCAATGYRGNLTQFAPSLGRIFQPISPMVELHRQLCARRMPTWILSNTNEIAVRCVTEDFPFFRQFTGYVFSFEVRSLKPEAVIYENLEQRAGCRGAEILYLDDRPENVAAAVARGWQALVHEDPAKTIPAVWARLPK